MLSVSQFGNWQVLALEIQNRSIQSRLSFDKLYIFLLALPHFSSIFLRFMTFSTADALQIITCTFMMRQAHLMLSEVGWSNKVSTISARICCKDSFLGCRVERSATNRPTPLRYRPPSRYTANFSRRECSLCIL